jgi:DNA-binding winged helix-turn-helix (wHTH) protein/pimeloyl-ACP methyl ester carboxylesterase
MPGFRDLRGAGSSETYQFGDFTLDLAEGRLSRAGSDIALRAKAFELLCLLIRGRGRLFSKDELIDTLWPDVIASEDSLTQLVSAIRSALGPGASDVIVTVPKRGYRFAAPVIAVTPLEQSIPEVHYAVSGDIRIAYQVVGDGPIDLVFIPGWVSHLEFGWESPRVASFYRRLASLSRFILFDKRGTGLSDRDFGLPSIEQRMDDLRAVLDAVGSKKAAVLTMSEGVGMSTVFAATFPERVTGLMLVSGFAKREWSPDYPWAPTPEERKTFLGAIEHGWGGPIGIEDIAPSLARDPAFRDWWATYQRRSASPSAALALGRMNTLIDCRRFLPMIKAPTLVMHRRGDRDAKIEEGRWIADQIPNASFLELPGDDHLIYAGNQEDILGPVQQFLADLPA